ncbi:MAG: RHS repeat-associated core domain-containing protein [Hymenobacter sp.]
MGVAAGLASIPQLGGGVPKGYLRVLVFDEDSALVSQQTQQLSQVANGGYEPLTQRVVLPQDGYVSAYVGNESDVDVLFDDVQVEHRPGLQVQETQYDPAGLELAGLSPPSPGIRGLNNYRFNGKEFQPDLGLAWNHQDWRFFDPQLLRWHAGDPEVENGQESWTPYSFGYDNAVRYADANGREPGDPPGKNIMGRMIYGTAVSLVNVNGQMWAALSGAKTKVAADFVYDNEGFIVDYDIHKSPVGTNAQELKSFALDEAKVFISLIGARAGGGALFEQAGSKAAAAEGVQAAKELLPGEGAVGTYKELKALGSKGDNITPHHISSANHMATRGVAKNEGISMNMEQPSPVLGVGTGQRQLMVTLRMLACRRETR